MDKNVSEYWGSADIKELRLALNDLKCPAAFHFEIIKKLISKSLDGEDRQRELASRAIAALIAPDTSNSDGDEGEDDKTGDGTGASSVVLSQTDVVKAFEVLLQRVEDLYLDVPNV